MTTARHTLSILTTAICSLVGLNCSLRGEELHYEPDVTPLTVPERARDDVVCFVLYTVSNNTLKLTATFFPLQEGEPRVAGLHFSNDGRNWSKVADEPVRPDGWSAHFRIENTSTDESFHFKVTHPLGSEYAGIIRAEPEDANEFRLGVLSCNSNTDRALKPDIVKNLTELDPDLLFFTGDQSYDHDEHYAAWLLFGIQFGELTRNRPTITIPDDHDIGQGNIWGSGGGKASSRNGDSGGYFKSVEYVNEVQRLQTWHLPDPVDATPLKDGITVYFTRLVWGGLDFAIIEDRKWKSGPGEFFPYPETGRIDLITDPQVDPAKFDVPEAELLGKRQMEFLDLWVEEWSGAEMKVLLSATPFAMPAHYTGTRDTRVHMDFDANGWPQGKRNRALEIIRKGFVFHIAGDQHLPAVMQYGVNDWRDASAVFVTPSIWNYWPRWWDPEDDDRKPSAKSKSGLLGDFFDGFGNKLSMMAVGNPTENNYDSAGFGLVTFHKKDRSIKIDCFPRFVDSIDQPDSQFPGWPVQIHQLDNYSRKAKGYLPEILVSSEAGFPVLKVYHEESGELEYSIRLWESSFKPPVFRTGSYRLTLEGETHQREFKHLDPFNGEQQVSILFE